MVAKLDRVGTPRLVPSHPVGAATVRLDADCENTPQSMPIARFTESCDNRERLSRKDSTLVARIDNEA